MKAIVAGADGFVGFNLVNELLNRGWIVFAVDVAPFPRRLKERTGLRYFGIGARKSKAIIEELASFAPFDVFYDFAWRGVSGPERSDVSIQMNNVTLTLEWLRGAKTLGCRFFIASGSIMEFETMQVTYEQNTAPGVGYVYGSAKMMAHELAKIVSNDIGIGLIWAYITNTYGVGEASPRLINNTLRNLISGNPLLFTEGNQNYDFVYISDVAKAFRLLGEKGVPNKGYVIGSGDAKPLKDFLKEIIDYYKPSQEVSFGKIPYSGAETPLSVFDIKDLKIDCGFTADVSFLDGIKKTYNWLKDGN